MTTSQPTDLDLLTARLDEINQQQLPLSASDIDDLIAIHRHARARRAAGEKPSRPRVDLSAIMGSLTARVAPKPDAGPKLKLKKD